MLNLSFLDKLDKDQRKWMTIAIAGMIVSDGVIDKRELNDLGGVLLHMENIEKAESLITMLKSREIPKLPAITVEDRTVATQMLFSLAKVGIVDNSLSSREADFLIYAGAVLSFPKDYVQEVLRWAKQQAELNKIQAAMAIKGTKMDVQDTELIGEYIGKVGAKRIP